MRKFWWVHLLTAALACSASDDSAPPRPQGYTLAPRVVVVTPAQADAAQVTDDGILFPRAGNEGLLAKVAGDILVGDRNSTGAATNRYGFARKVAAVEERPDGIFVRTSANAALEEIYTSAVIDRKATLDELPLLPLRDGQITPQDLHIDARVSKTFGGTFGPLPIVPKLALQIPFKVKGKDAKIQVEGSIELSRAKLLFTPSIDLGVHVGGAIPSRLDHFHLAFGGRADVEVLGKADVTSEIGVAVGVADLTEDDKYDLARTVEDWLKAHVEPRANPSFESPDVMRFEVVGPAIGVVPTTFEFSMKIACTVKLKGGVSYERGVTGSADLKLGAAYEPATGWVSLSSGEFSTGVIGQGFTKASASIELACGLKPKLSWKLAAALGPFFSLEAGNKLSLQYAEVCPSNLPSGKPRGNLTLSSDLYAKATAGGEVKVLGIQIAELGLGLLDKSFPLAQATWDFEDRFVIGSCAMPDGGSQPGTGDQLTSSPYSNNTCAVKNGLVYCWGQNTSGQVGDGTRNPRATPYQVPGVSGVTDVSTYNGATWVNTAGGVYCWGLGAYCHSVGNDAAASAPDSLTPLRITLAAVPVKLRRHLGIDASGSVFGMAEWIPRFMRDTTPDAGPVVLTNLVAATDQYGAFYALGADSRVWIGAFDMRPYDATAVGFAGPFSDVQGAENTVCLRSSTGNVQCRSTNGITCGAPSTPSGTLTWFTGASDMTIGKRHSCAITGGAAQTLLCCGDNATGQRGDASATIFSDPAAAVKNLGPVKKVVVGVSHTCAIDTNNALWCWGSNEFGQLGSGAIGSDANVPRAVTLP